MQCVQIISAFGSAAGLFADSVIYGDQCFQNKITAITSPVIYLVLFFRTSQNAPEICVVQWKKNLLRYFMTPL